MTPELAPAVATALWLGILTSISPCPLATNIAAVSYIARRIDRPRLVLLSAFTYSLGRAVAYAAVSAVVVLGLLSVPGVSQFLQRYMNKLLGPLLVLVGMYLLGLLISFGVSTTAGSDELRKKAAEGGVLGAALLGALFALSFCPVSAALFFGSLVPLSLQHGSKVVLPVVYGLGTALPVVAPRPRRDRRGTKALSARAEEGRDVRGLGAARHRRRLRRRRDLPLRAVRLPGVTCGRGMPASVTSRLRPCLGEHLGPLEDRLHRLSLLVGRAVVSAETRRTNARVSMPGR